MQQAPKGGPGPRTRPSRERVGAGSTGRGDPVFAHLVRREGGDAGNLVRQVNGRPGRSGGCGRQRRRRLRPSHRELGGDTFRGSIRTGRRGRPSGRPGRRKARRWAARLGAFGLVVLRAWDRVATSARCSPPGNRWQTTPEGRSGQKPHEWQRSSRPQRGRGANRRGSEKLRGRNVPGEASPGRADPATDVAEGAPKPHEGNRRPRSPVGGEARALRGRPSLWEPLGRLRPGRPDGERPRGRGNGEEGAVNQ